MYIHSQSATCVRARSCIRFRPCRGIPKPGVTAVYSLDRSVPETQGSIPRRLVKSAAVCSSILLPKAKVLKGGVSLTGVSGQVQDDRQQGILAVGTAGPSIQPFDQGEDATDSTTDKAPNQAWRTTTTLAQDGAMLQYKKNNTIERHDTKLKSFVRLCVLSTPRSRPSPKAKSKAADGPLWGPVSEPGRMSNNGQESTNSTRIGVAPKKQFWLLDRLFVPAAPVGASTHAYACPFLFRSNPSWSHLNRRSVLLHWPGTNTHVWKLCCRSCACQGFRGCQLSSRIAIF